MADKKMNWPDTRPRGKTAALPVATRTVSALINRIKIMRTLWPLFIFPFGWLRFCFVCCRAGATDLGVFCCCLQAVRHQLEMVFNQWPTGGQRHSSAFCASPLSGATVSIAPHGLYLAALQLSARVGTSLIEHLICRMLPGGQVHAGGEALSDKGFAQPED